MGASFNHSNTHANSSCISIARTDVNVCAYTNACGITKPDTITN